MAPILKEAEAPVVTATTAAPPAAPQSKSASDAPARPQPVAVEIPVTVNGARTLDGSDKREPFSESTQTVLVFAHGAVLRTATPLVPGQLVFLTNEKSKKEVVCQVLKTKSAGAAGGYVELQFTEPAPGFWGLSMPSAPAAPAASRPPAPSAPKIVPPAPQAAKPVAPKPVAPAAVVPPPAKPAVAPLPPAAKLEPVAPLAVAPPPPPALKPEPVAPRSAAPEPAAPRFTVVPPPPPVATVPEPPPALATPPAPADAAPQTPVPPVISPALLAAKLPAPVAPLHDYSKEIHALFAVPQAPAATPESKPEVEQIPAPASSSPSSEELKLQTARLQEQLSSLLFTDKPAAPPAHSVSPEPANVPLHVTEVAHKILEIAKEEPKPVVLTEPVPAPPVRKPASASFSSDEEVKIPAWLAPLSQNSNSPAADSTAPTDVDSEAAQAISVNSEESYDALVPETHHRPQTAVFGGQLLGESSSQADQAASGGSRKGLFLGLAAALLLAVAGAWYFTQNHSASSSVAAAPSASVPASTAPAVVPGPVVSTPPASTANRPSSAATPASAQPAKNPAPAAAPPVSTPAPESRNSNPAPRNLAPVEPPKKSALGDVHLGAPVVNRGAASQQTGDAVPAIETDSSSNAADAVAAGALRHNQPAVPLPVGGDVKPAQLLSSVPPVYPQIAKSQRIAGNVQIDAFIDASGNVATVKVISGPAVLHQAALDAVKKWKYSPAMLDGQPTPMHLTVTVQFRNQ